MDKDLLKASVAFLVVLMVYQTFFVKKMPPVSKNMKQTVVEKVISNEVNDNQNINNEKAELVQEQPQSNNLVKTNSFEESISTIKTPSSTINMSNRGGKINSIHFNKYNSEIKFAPVNSPLAIKRVGKINNIDTYKFDITPNDTSMLTSCVINDNLSINTTLIPEKEDYLYTYEVTINNNSNQEQFFSEGLEIVAGNLPMLKNKSRPILNFTKYTIEEKASYLAHKKVKGFKSEEDPFYWGGVQNTTYCSLIKGEDLFQKVKYIKNSLLDDVENISLTATTKDFSVAGNDKLTFVFKFYMGPKLFFHMKQLGQTFENVIDYGAILGPITKLLVLCLNFLFGLTKNYGIAIILLTIAFKLITYPLTKKSMVSMKQMQKLGPQIKQLQQQHKNNQAEASKATMGLYKKHGVNPLSSCFPMLIQMPLFFAFFKAISNSVELQGEKFLLIKDLALPDAIIHLPKVLPLVGDSLNILPLFLGVIQFTSSKQTITDPAQKSMLYGMPIFMTVIFYNMPSALVLYFFVSTLIGIVQNHLIKSA